MSTPPVVRGFLADPLRLPPLILTFPFNPASIRDNRTLQQAEEEGAGIGALSKKRTAVVAGERTLSFSFQLHGLEEGSNPLPGAALGGISTELARLRSFLYPREDAWALPLDKELGAWTRSPPRCLFGFGARVLECTVLGIEIEETQFNAALAPVRAEVSVTLAVVEEEGNALYEVDRQRRNLLAALGLVNTRLF